jgi:hypothetical protein
MNLTPTTPTSPKEATMSDFTLTSSGFAATTITVEAVTEAGKALFAEMFGRGAVSVEMPKSKGLDFAVFAERKGLRA